MKPKRHQQKRWGGVPQWNRTVILLTKKIKKARGLNVSVMSQANFLKRIGNFQKGPLNMLIDFKNEDKPMVERRFALYFL